MEYPSELGGWTYEAVRNLAEARASEPAAFDFKAAAILWNPEGSRTLSKAACAFANAGGGFIILGVGEDGDDWKPSGVVRDKEINKRINDRIQLQPPISYPAAKELRFPTQTERAFYVIAIPDSDKGPHASVAEGFAVFYERTHSGSVPMSWGAIRDRMLRMEERRGRSRLLLHELDEQLNVARLHISTDTKNLELNFAMFEVQSIQRLLDDLHPLIADDPSLMEAASGALSLMRQFNVELEFRLMHIATPLGTGRNRATPRR